MALKRVATLSYNEKEDVQDLHYDDQLLPLLDNDGFLNVKGRNYLWNIETWEWEAATKGTGMGEAVEVENFPAVISGAIVPISDALDDPTAKYKITSLDTGGETKYFGYLDKDGNWYVMRLTKTQGLYAKGGNVSDYLNCWDENGNYVGTLTFDYFNNVF